MKTYLTVTFSSEGGRPSVINRTLANLGFHPATGAHDWVYEWPGDASVEEVLHFADQIHAELEGLQVFFEMETV